MHKKAKRNERKSENDKNKNKQEQTKQENPKNAELIPKSRPVQFPHAELAVSQTGEYHFVVATHTRVRRSTPPHRMYTSCSAKI